MLPRPAAPAFDGAVGTDSHDRMDPADKLLSAKG
jgi:hypothetical protein